MNLLSSWLKILISVNRIHVYLRLLSAFCKFIKFSWVYMLLLIFWEYEIVWNKSKSSGNKTNSQPAIIRVYLV